MTTALSAKVWIDIGDGELEYDAFYDYSPGRPGVHTLRNGDPGYPDEPPELYVTELVRDGVLQPLYGADGEPAIPDAVIDKIESQIWEVIEDQNASADEAEYESCAQHQKDADDYFSDIAADQYQRELDAKASQ